MKKVNILIVGTGAIAKEHMAGYQQCKDACVIAACDSNVDRLTEFADRYQIPRRYTDFEAALADGDIDAVDICTPNFSHAAFSVKALKSNRSVMCEKPIARNAEEAQQIVEAAANSKGFFMPAYVLLFSPAYRVVKDYINSGFFGEIYYCKAKVIKNDGGPGGWSNQKALSGGGALIDMGMHDLYSSIHLLGNPRIASVFGAAFQKLDDRPLKTGGWHFTGPQVASEVEDFASGMVRFENGAMLHIEAAYAVNGEGSGHIIEIYGTKGGAKIQFPNDVTFFMEQNGYLVDIVPEKITTIAGGSDQFVLEMKHFVDCCLKCADCVPSAEAGLSVAKIVDAIYKSSETGHEVCFNG